MKIVSKLLLVLAAAPVTHSSDICTESQTVTLIKSETVTKTMTVTETETVIVTVTSKSK